MVVVGLALCLRVVKSRIGAADLGPYVVFVIRHCFPLSYLLAKSFDFDFSQRLAEPLRDSRQAPKSSLVRMVLECLVAVTEVVVVYIRHSRG